jgi:hypothetical protein
MNILHFNLHYPPWANVNTIDAMHAATLLHRSSAHLIQQLQRIKYTYCYLVN